MWTFYRSVFYFNFLFTLKMYLMFSVNNYNVLDLIDMYMHGWKYILLNNFQGFFEEKLDEIYWILF